MVFPRHRFTGKEIADWLNSFSEDVDWWVDTDHELIDSLKSISPLPCSSKKLAVEISKIKQLYVQDVREKENQIERPSLDDLVETKELGVPTLGLSREKEGDIFILFQEKEDGLDGS